VSLSSPSPSWFAKTPYCSVRDWTRFLRHRIKKYPDTPVHTLTDSLRIYFFPLWRAYLFFYGFAVEFAVYVWTVAVSGTKKLRIRKYPYTCGRGLNTISRASESSCIEMFHRHLLTLHSQWEETHIQFLSLEEILPKPPQKGCYSVSFEMHVSGAAFLVWKIQKQKCL